MKKQKNRADTKKTFSKIYGFKFKTAQAHLEKKLHSHNTHILTGVEKGVITIRTPSRSWVLPQNTVIMIPKDTLHSTEMMKGYEGWIISIPSYLTHQRFSEISALQSSDLLNACARRILTWEKKTKFSTSEQKIIEVFLNEINSVQPAPFLDIPMPESDLLKKVARYVFENKTEKSDIKTVSKFSGLSERTLMRHFIKETGLKYTLWKNKVKIYQALHMLSKGKTVTEITYDLGYNNVSAFIAMFKKHLGVSPKFYLKNTMRQKQI